VLCNEKRNKYSFNNVASIETMSTRMNEIKPTQVLLEKQKHLAINLKAESIYTCRIAEYTVEILFLITSRVCLLLKKKKK